MTQRSVQRIVLQMMSDSNHALQQPFRGEFHGQVAARGSIVNCKRAVFDRLHKVRHLSSIGCCLERLLMTTLRRFRCDDLFQFNAVNLDYFTETVSRPCAGLKSSVPAPFPTPPVHVSFCHMASHLTQAQLQRVQLHRAIMRPQQRAAQANKPNARCQRGRPEFAACVTDVNRELQCI